MQVLVLEPLVVQDYQTPLLVEAQFSTLAEVAVLEILRLALEAMAAEEQHLTQFLVLLELQTQVEAAVVLKVQQAAQADQAMSSL